MAGVLSLNGAFTYPIEILKTLTVDEKSSFKKSVAIGNCSVDEGRIGLSHGDGTQVSEDYANAFGHNSIAKGKYSVAIGESSETGVNAETAFALGSTAAASHKNSFVWSGENTSPKYESQGEGTFCVKPKGSDNLPENGLFIGNSSLPTIINKYAITAVCGNANVFTSTNEFQNGFTVSNGNINVSGGSINVSDSVISTFNGNVNVADQQLTDSSSLVANTRFVKNSIDTCVLLSGSTMSGKLTLSGDPTESMHAATKQYVDNNSTVTTIDNSMQTVGREVAKITITGTTKTDVKSIKVPRIIDGQNTTVYENTVDGTIKISCTPNISVVGGTLKVPVGTIIPFAGSNEPSGFKFCNGSEVSRTEYAELFAAIGTTFGGGNGTTTFNLPNLSDNRFIEGATSNGTTHNAGLPNITGRYGWGDRQDGTALTEGAFYDNGTISNCKDAWGSTGIVPVMAFDASRCSTIYGSSTTVQPKSLTLRYYIKYTQTTEEKYVLKVNGEVADENGNVNVGTVKKVNNTSPDSNGNVSLNFSFFPNYSAGATTISSGTVMDKNGWIKCWRGGSDQIGRVYVNGLEVWNSTLYDSHYGMGLIPVSINDKVTYNGTANAAFIPCK